MLDLIKEYVSKRIDLLKLEATEKTSIMIGTLSVLIVMATLGIFFLLMINMGLGFLLGHLLGNYAYGLLIMSGFYLLLLIIAYLYRNKIKESIANIIIETLDDD